MKLSKQVLKAIVKECIVEILAEGLGTNLVETAQKRQTLQPVSSNRAPVATSQRQPVNSNLVEAVKRASGGDSNLASVLADTAATSLQTVLAKDRVFVNDENGPLIERFQPEPPPGSVEGIVAKHAPEEIFGEAMASNWEKLAFMSSPKK